MPVAAEATFTVALDALVAALRAVEPHALRGDDSDSDRDPYDDVAAPALKFTGANN